MLDLGDKDFRYNKHVQKLKVSMVLVNNRKVTSTEKWKLYLKN